MIGAVNFRKNPQIKKVESAFNPSEAVKRITSFAQDKFIQGHDNMHDSYREFNDRSIIDRMNVDQKAFNSYVEPRSNDPEEEWKYNGVHPMTRNASMVMAAQMTARLLYPNVFAQNENDENDRMWGTIMRDLILYHIENSNYEKVVLFSVISAIVNPCAYIEVTFSENLQLIRKKLEDGTMKLEEAVDEVFSGLQLYNIPVEEVFIANPYGGTDIQRQEFIFRNRKISLSEAETKYGEHENFDHIVVGNNLFFNDADGEFYMQDDGDEVQNKIVNETILYHRTLDLEVPFVNGIYLGNTDVENNPIRHRTNTNRPKYNLAHFGFAPIDEGQFFYFKSLVFTMENEQDFANTMIRLTVDGSVMDLLNPVVLTGEVDDEFNGSILFPGRVTIFDEEVKVTPIRTGNTQAGYQGMQKAEEMQNESVQSEVLGGNLPEATQKAFNVARAEANARIKLSVFGKQIGWAVEQIGDLMNDLIIQHQTIGEVGEIVGGITQLKYKTFILNDQKEKGKKISKKIVFTENLLNTSFTKEQMLQESFKIMEKEGGIDAEQRLIFVNPQLFRKLSFKITVNADAIPVKSQELEKQLNLIAWREMIQSPFANRKAVDRDFLFETFAEGESDKYMKNNPQDIMGVNKSNEQNSLENVIEGRQQELQQLPV